MFTANYVFWSMKCGGLMQGEIVTVESGDNPRLYLLYVLRISSDKLLCYSRTWVLLGLSPWPCVGPRGNHRKEGTRLISSRNGCLLKADKP